MKTKNGQPSHTSPKIRKTDQPLQTYQHKQCIQKHKYNTAIRETKDAREKPGLQHERNIQTHL